MNYMRFLTVTMSLVLFQLLSVCNTAMAYSVSEDGYSDVMSDTVQKVGLVLSGGGAKGIAHVGVIKALEDNDIPIDYVAGTSMGAIVGSLYSCGWSPSRMMSMFTSKAFGYWSSGKIDPDYTYYFSRPEPSPQWVSVNLNFRDSAGSIADQIIPSNLISPIPMNMEFLRLYAPYSDQCGEDFNRLFVPFRCVASNVYAKHKIVCRNGSLGDAVRASMSFPLVFKPIEMDGVLVYDGGIYDNFPVDVMRNDFHPDFIIGVSVSSADTKPMQNDVYSQLEDMIIQNNNYSLPEDEGVKIQVPVLDFGVLDFGKAQTIYDIGYKTGLSMVDSIKSRLKARRSLEEVDRRRVIFAGETPGVMFDRVDITGATPGQARYLRNLFDTGNDGGIDMASVQDSYYRAVTDGKLSDLLPQAIFGSDGNNTLLLKASVKNPWQIGVGGWITSSAHSQLYIGAGYHTLNYNSLDLDLRGWIGQSYMAGELSARFAINSVTPSCMQFDFTASKQKYYDSEILFYENSSPTFITDREYLFRLTYWRALGRKAKGFAGISHGWISDSYFPTGVTDFSIAAKDRSRYMITSVRAGFERNSLDDRMYPSHGMEFTADVSAGYTHSRYIPGGGASASKADQLGGRVRLLWRNYFPIMQRVSLGVMANSVVSIGKLYQNYTATLVSAPAFAPAPSTRNYFIPAFRAESYVAAGFMPVWSPVSRLQLRGDFYVFSPIRHLHHLPDGGCIYSGWMRNVEFIGEVAAVYNLPFASISVYGNYLSSPARNWNFGINFGLFIQAPRLRN